MCGLCLSNVVSCDAGRNFYSFVFIPKNHEVVFIFISESIRKVPIKNNQKQSIIVPSKEINYCFELVKLVFQLLFPRFSWPRSWKCGDDEAVGTKDNEEKQILMDLIHDFKSSSLPSACEAPRSVMAHTHDFTNSARSIIIIMDVKELIKLLLVAVP